MLCIMNNIPEEEIKEMVTHLYGVCVWQRIRGEILACYPTSAGEVFILPESSQPSNSADGEKGVCDCGNSMSPYRHKCVACTIKDSRR